MDISWQRTFTLACATLLAAVVPGTLGYANARLEVATQQRQESLRIRAEIQASQDALRQMSTPCQTIPDDSADGGS